MISRMNKSLLAVAVSGLLASPMVQATNGYFSHGYSTKEKGMAGAGAAYSQDSMAAATNPAGMAFVGERMDLGLQLFSPSPRSYTVTDPGGLLPLAPDGTPFTAFCAPGPSVPCQPPFSVNPGSIDSENDFFLIPSFGYNWILDPMATVGISVYGNGGMNTEYEGGSAATLNSATFAFDNNLPGTFGAGTAGVNLAQLFTNASYARKLDENNAIGASLIFAYQRFASSGLAGFSGFSNDPANLTNNVNSYSTGFGLKLGYQGKVADKLRVGVSYQSEFDMSEFDEYKGLFAENGDFDIPSTYTVGLAYDLGNSSKVVVDVQRINYSDVAAISNPISHLTDGTCLDALNATVANAMTPTPASGPGCLGGSNGAGFGWEDMTIVKLGYEMKSGDNTMRFGFSHGSQPIPESETLFNILAPAVIEQHLTFGLTMPMANNQEFNFAAAYMPNNSVKGPNPFDGGATQIEIEMSQLDFQAGWAWKY